MKKFDIGDTVLVKFATYNFVAEVRDVHDAIVTVIDNNSCLLDVHISNIELMETPKKKPWADVIHAWADGKEIQYRETTNRNRSDWLDFGYERLIPAFFSLTTEWRIKPKTITSRYRMALIGTKVTAINVTDGEPAVVPQDFVCWVGETVDVVSEVQ